MVGGGVQFLCNQGRSPRSREEVPRGGGYGRGVSPLPMYKKIEIRCLLKHSKLHIIMCIVHTKRANI